MREYISPQLRAEVLKRDGNRCRYCGTMTPPFHLDHVYPVYRGGETTLENLVCSCAKCNIEKGYGTGIFPKPVGYFRKRSIRMIMNFILLIVWNIVGISYLKSVDMRYCNLLVILLLEIVPCLLVIYAQTDFKSTGK